MQGFEFTMQAAFRTFIFVGYTLLALTARKRISQVNVVYHCGNSDQMALPSVDFLNPLPLGLFVLTCSFVRLTCYFLGKKTDFHFPKVRFVISLLSRPRQPSYVSL